MKHCPQCGTPCDESNLICKNCGYLFAQNPTQGAPQGANRPYNEYDHNVYNNGIYNNQTSGYEKKPTGNMPPPFTYYQLPYQQGSPPKNNSLAVASMVLGIVGLVLSLCCIGVIPSILAIIFGVVSKALITRSAGRELGNGMATSGIVMGIIGVSLLIIIIILNILGTLTNLSLFNNFTNDYSQYYSGNAFNT
jgi:hypothetical protein